MLVWLLILVVPPGLRTETLVVQSMMQTAVTIGYSMWLIVRRPRTLDQVHPDPRS